MVRNCAEDKMVLPGNTNRGPYNGYEVPPRFRKQQHHHQHQQLQIQRHAADSVSPPQSRRKINFEDFLPPEHRANSPKGVVSMMKKQQQNGTNATAKELLIESLSKGDDSGIELTEDENNLKADTPPRFLSSSNSSNNSYGPPTNGKKKENSSSSPLPEGVVTSSGRFVPLTGRKGRARHRGASHQHPTLVPVPPVFFAGPPALQFAAAAYHQQAAAAAHFCQPQFYDPRPLPAATVYAASFVPNTNGETLDFGGHGQHHQTTTYGVVAAQQVELDGTVRDADGTAPQNVKSSTPLQQRKPMKSSENTFQYVYRPPPDEPASVYSCAPDPEPETQPEPEFRFGSRRRSPEGPAGGGGALMDFSWEKFCSELTDTVIGDGAAPDGSENGTGGQRVKKGGAEEPGAVPVFARSPPASAVPLPPVDWLAAA